MRATMLLADEASTGTPMARSCDGVHWRRTVRGR